MTDGIIVIITHTLLFNINQYRDMLNFEEAVRLRNAVEVVQRLSDFLYRIIFLEKKKKKKHFHVHAPFA